MMTTNAQEGSWIAALVFIAGSLLIAENFRLRNAAIRAKLAKVIPSTPEKPKAGDIMVCLVQWL